MPPQYPFEADHTDLSASSQIAALLELSATFATFDDPASILDAFVKGMARIYGPRCYVELVTAGLQPGEYRIGRLRAIDGTEMVPIHGAWMDTTNPVQRGGFLGSIVSAAQPILASNVVIPPDPVVGDVLCNYHSAMAVPAVDKDAVNWVVLLHTAVDNFTLADLEQLIVRVSVVNVMINNMNIRLQLARANRQIAGEINHIADIQRALLPELRENQIPGLSIATSYETFDHAGGDMYDLIDLGRRSGYSGNKPDRRWAILVGDVSGHGPAAAVVMAMFHAMLHGYQHRPTGPADLLQYANIQLCANPVDQSFITAFLAFYEPQTRALRYARAGHPPPLLRKVDGTIVELKQVGDLPLGIFAETEYWEQSLTLAPGEIIVFYTDGITEAMNPAGEMLGSATLARVVKSHPGDAKTLLQAIRDAVKKHQSGRPSGDDQTVMIVQSEPA